MRPDYYKNNGVEPIDVSRYMHGCAAQVYQYIFRAGRKDKGIDDCTKAITLMRVWCISASDLPEPTWRAVIFAERAHTTLLCGLPVQRRALLESVLKAWTIGLSEQGMREITDGIEGFREFLVNSPKLEKVKFSD